MRLESFDKRQLLLFRDMLILRSQDVCRKIQAKLKRMIMKTEQAVKEARKDVDAL
jgi:hypothetical protein